jgi:hypothetical protein
LSHWCPCPRESTPDGSTSAAGLNILTMRVHEIIHEKLGYRKMAS